MLVGVAAAAAVVTLALSAWLRNDSPVPVTRFSLELAQAQGLAVVPGHRVVIERLSHSAPHERHNSNP